MPFYPCYTLVLEHRAQDYFRQRKLVADWPAPANVHAFTTMRADEEHVASPATWLDLGVRGNGGALAGVGRRDDFAWYGGLPSTPHWLHQVHGVRVVGFDQPGPCPYARLGEHDPAALQRILDSEPEADAAVSRVPDVVLAIQTADCLPVLFCAEDGSEIAAAHAGWRGLSAGVLEATLALMRTPRAKILAWLGPAIAARSYEVGHEVRDAFLAHAPAAADAFVATRPGHWRCDLYALSRQRLYAAGVTQISGGGFDTFSDERLHSYRRDGAHSGRMVSLVWVTRDVDGTCCG